MRRNLRALVFLAVVILLAGTALGYVLWSRSRVDLSSRSAAESNPEVDAGALLRLQTQPHILFRNSDLSAGHGRVFVATAGEHETPKYATPLSCERVHFANGRGVCLIAERGLRTTYRAAIFGPAFEELHQIPLPGIPSRVRLSPSGRFAGITVFVSGDSYASGSFSTRAIVLDTTTGQVLGDLEQYAVTQDGRPFKAVDFNFWGFTFADDRRFYATLQTRGARYLIAGDLSTRTAQVIDNGIECPALSPDGTRVAFKKRELIDGRVGWRIGVQNLATRRVTVLSETRSVDDQPEWLDDGRVIYALPSESRPGSTDVWVVRADGSSTPALYRQSAWSPAVVRLAGATTAP